MQFDAASSHRSSPGFGAVDGCQLRDLVTVASEPRVGVNEVPFVANLSAGSSVDILQTLISDAPLSHETSQIILQRLVQARHAAISAVASEASSHSPSLRIQHLFVLHLIRHEKLFLEHINRCLLSGELMEVWRPFIACVLDALHALPDTDAPASVFCLKPGAVDSAVFSEGSVLSWAGFLPVTADASLLASAQEPACAALEQEIILRMKSNKVKFFPESLGGRNCGILPSGTLMRVVRVHHDSVYEIDLEEVT